MVTPIEFVYSKLEEAVAKKKDLLLSPDRESFTEVDNVIVLCLNWIQELATFNDVEKEISDKVSAGAAVRAFEVRNGMLISDIIEISNKAMGLTAPFIT